jgi:hypothetical protein
MKNNVETQLRRLLRKTSGLDIMVLAVSDFHLRPVWHLQMVCLRGQCPSPPAARHRLGALYPALGVQGLSYALGVVENITLLALIAGFSGRQWVQQAP